MPDEKRGGCRPGGCGVLLALAVLLAMVLGSLVGVATWQEKTRAPEPLDFAIAAPAPSPAGRAMRLELSLQTAGVMFTPGPAGGDFRVESNFDPSRYELTQQQAGDPDDLSVTVDFGPRGWRAMAFLRAKLQRRMPTLEVSIPRDVRLTLDLHMDRGIALGEFGGTAVEEIVARGRQSGVQLSFERALVAPLRKLDLKLTAGGIGVRGLGNASPLSTVIEQKLGYVDLDLRGQWAGDAELAVLGKLGSGTLWLPENVRLTGLDHEECIEHSGEVPLPTLAVLFDGDLGPLFIIDPCAGQ